MKIYQEAPSDVERYIESKGSSAREEKEKEYHEILRNIGKLKTIDQDTQILEVGTGLGWFQIGCKTNGLHCKGLEISPQLIEHAQKLGIENGVEIDIDLGNIEETDLGKNRYDVVVATSTFEHVENWRAGIKNIFSTLKPDGLFYFFSTNKFSIISGEFNIPFYGWLPDRWRYRLRIYKQGRDIMKLGIDFNQFTYFQLRDFFRNVGFSKVLDKIDLYNPETLDNPKFWKKAILALQLKCTPLKHFPLLFAPGTFFICIK